MRVENVKGAVWTVDEMEFYKRRPQRLQERLPSSGNASNGSPHGSLEGLSTLTGLASSGDRSAVDNIAAVSSLLPAFLSGNNSLVNSKLSASLNGLMTSSLLNPGSKTEVASHSRSPSPASRSQSRSPSPPSHLQHCLQTQDKDDGGDHAMSSSGLNVESGQQQQHDHRASSSHRVSDEGLSRSPSPSRLTPLPSPPPSPSDDHRQDLDDEDEAGFL